MSLTKSYQCTGQLTLAELFPDSWCGKTYPEPLAPTKEKTSELSSKKQRGSKIKVPLFLDLRGGRSGLRAVLSWETDGLSLGEYTMLSFGEFPSVENESHLSQILEEKPLPKYFLSAKACQGILRRAKERGKILPELLYKTLLKQSASKNELAVLGGVKESSSSMTESEHCQPSTINQYCLNDQGGQQISVSENVSGTLRAEEHGHQPLVFEPGAASRVGGHVYEDGKAGTVRANAGDNQQAVVYGISAYESNAMKSQNPNSGIYKADTTRTLDNNGGNPACNQGGMIVLEGNGSRPSHKGDGYSESDVSYTLNATEHHAVCAELGGAEPYTASKASFFCKSRCDGKAETLVATDYKDPQIVCYGLDRASFNQGQNAKYNFSVENDLAQTIVAKGPGGVLSKKNESI